MSNGKNIEVRIAATGGSEAAAEVRKVESAVESLDSSASASSQGIDDLNAQLDEMRARAEALKEETVEVAKEQESANQAMRLGRSAAIGLGIGGATVAKIFGEISKGLASLDIEKLREMDAAMAAQVETARGWSEVLTDPINGIQRLISGSTIGEAFSDVNDQLARNAEMQAEAIDRMIQNGRRTAAEISALAKEIAAANAVLDAKDETSGLVRDREDAARIRAGVPKEDVQAERAARDRDIELERLNRTLQPKAAATQARFDDAQQAQGNAGRVQTDPRATPQDRQKALAEAEKARIAFEEAKAEYDAAKALVMERRNAVREQFTTTVDELGGNKAARLAKERDEETRRRARDEADARRAQLEAQREAQRTALAGRAAGNEARVRNAPASQGNRLLQDLAGDIGNADSEAEIAALGAKITASQGQLSAAMVNSLRQILTQQEAMVQQIAALEANIKSTRGK